MCGGGGGSGFLCVCLEGGCGVGFCAGGGGGGAGGSGPLCGMSGSVCGGGGGGGGGGGLCVIGESLRCLGLCVGVGVRGALCVCTRVWASSWDGWASVYVCGRHLGLCVCLLGVNLSPEFVNLYFPYAGWVLLFFRWHQRHFEFQLAHVAVEGRSNVVLNMHAQLQISLLMRFLSILHYSLVQYAKKSHQK